MDFREVSIWHHFEGKKTKSYLITRKSKRHFVKLGALQGIGPPKEILFPQFLSYKKILWKLDVDKQWKQWKYY